MPEISKKTEGLKGLLLTGKRFKEILADPTEGGLEEIDEAIETIREMAPEERNELQSDVGLVSLLDFTVLLDETKNMLEKDPSPFGIDTKKEFGERLKLARENAGLVFRGRQEGYMTWGMGGVEIPLYKLDQEGDLSLVPEIRINTTVYTVTLCMRELIPIDSPSGGIVWSVSSGAL